ncbi:hypothetical protein [Nocardioides terrae]|uniref:hypothetical protein n=1 Tax=Nocardioides terrae TaxID=574651 RepID=UPI001113DA9F|nr:hypothetical protein [Nocardioides terrae]
MTGDDARITRVTEGGEIQLPYADVLTLAGSVEETGHGALHAATRAGAVATSPHLLASAPFSPATAAAAEAALVGLGAALTAWSGATVLDAQAVRQAAHLLAEADDVAQVGLLNLEHTVAASYGREGVAPVVRPTGLEVRSSTTAPADLASLIEHVGQLNDLSDADHPGNKGTIEVQTVTAADGTRRHIVYLPGLDDFDPVSVDGDVRDVGAAVALEAGVPTAYGAGVVQALHDAGVRPDEDVLIVGHSQGGMQAAALAVQGTPYHLTQVVTAGSPVVPGHLHPGVHVLSLEHQGDGIPLLDAGSADHSAHHVTVTFAEGHSPDPFGNHDASHYVAGAHAAEASTDPVVHEAVADLDPFLAHPGEEVESTVFQITRGDGR